MTPNLDEDFWEDLLTLIEEGKVIPVIGAGVVTRGDDQGLFYPWLASRLAEKLAIPLETRTTAIGLNDVATAHLLNRGDGNALCTRIARILRDECPAPPVVIDDSPLPTAREPRAFHHIQATQCKGGAITPAFAERLLGLQRNAMSAPQ
jgi:hypothetical protein